MVSNFSVVWRSLETLEPSISTSGCHADLPINATCLLTVTESGKASAVSARQAWVLTRSAVERFLATWHGSR